MFVLRNEDHTKYINTIFEQNAESVMLQHMVCAVTAKTETLDKHILKKIKKSF